MKLNERTVLVAMAQVFEDYPERWTSHAYRATTSDGKACFCAAGFLYQSINEGLITPEQCKGAYQRFQSVIGGGAVSAFNDQYGRLAVIAKAREAAKPLHKSGDGK